ncbi:hypothetical protein BSM4216_3324 [Bacillus smithii]|nr:hypothetical protein BSM4216_3324 [Bacillus smithii]
MLIKPKKQTRFRFQSETGLPISHLFSHFIPDDCRHLGLP